MRKDAASLLYGSYFGQGGNGLSGLESMLMAVPAVTTSRALFTRLSVPIARATATVHPIRRIQRRRMLWRQAMVRETEDVTWVL